MKMYRLVGLLYLISGSWCAVFPQKSASYLGFGLETNASLVEFFAVYGGLQVGLGLAIVLTSMIAKYQEAGEFFSAVFSVSLLTFRLIAVAIFGFEKAMVWMFLLEGFIAAVLWRDWHQRKQLAEA